MASREWGGACIMLPHGVDDEVTPLNQLIL